MAKNQMDFNQRDVELRSDSRSSGSIDRNSKAFSSIFSIIFFLLIVVALFWNLSGRSSFPTLESFLEMLQEVPAIGTNWISFIDFSLDLPDWLNWLNSVLSFFEGIVQLGSFIIVGLLNVVPFILYFLRWIFL